MVPLASRDKSLGRVLEVAQTAFPERSILIPAIYELHTIAGQEADVRSVPNEMDPGIIHLSRQS